MGINNDQSQKSVKIKVINQNIATCPSIKAAYRQITRDDIKSALKKVYAAEEEPVQVGSVKTRTSLALLFIIIGTIMITSMLGIKYLALELSQVLLGIMVLVLAFTIGFTISTSNIRNIHRSMSRFKDLNVPAYRKVFPSSKWQGQALVYATLVCLIFLGAQSFNLLLLNNPQTTPADDVSDIDPIIIYEDMPKIDYATFQPYSTNNQEYMKIRVKLNNTKNFYSENLILNLQSYFIGQVYDKRNITLSEPGKTEFDIYLKIHEPDDTSIKISLVHREKDGERLLQSSERLSLTDIYIAEAEGRIISKPFSFTKSVEISVKVYNAGPARQPETVTLIITSPSMSRPFIDREVKNNETIKRNEFWEYKTKVDNIIDDELVFEVKLEVSEETKDEAMVKSN